MWEKTTDSIIANFHMNGFRRRSNAHAYYSPTVDRFFAVDTFDPYTALEVAQILSSKMPGITICILQGTDVVMDNANCINYTIEEKNLTVGSANVLYGRQTPSLTKIPLGVNIVKLGPTPLLDFDTPDQYNKFLEFHEYAKFCIRAWHAAKLTDAINNILPMEDYTSLIDVPAGFNVPADSTNSGMDISYKTAIKRILYNSNSVDHALAEIYAMWSKNLTAITIPHKRFFYSMLEIPDPDQGTEVHSVDRLTLSSV